VDSSAVLNVSSQLVVGNFGDGSIQVLRGADLNPGADLFFGRFAGSSATGLVRGAGSKINMSNMLELGGAAGTPGGASVLTVDSSAVVQVGTTSGNINIYPGTGHLVVRDGGTILAGPIWLDGACDISAGRIDANGIFVGATGRLSGRGVVNGSIISSGLVDLVPAAGTLGALRVNGAATLQGAGTLGVALGRVTGPGSDTLSCSATLTVGGTLALSADPSFVRTVGDSFVVATGSPVSGSFSNVTWNGAPGAALFDVVVRPTRVVVFVKSATLGVGDGAERPGVLRFRSVSSLSHLAFALDLPADAEVRVALLDVTGREVARLHEGRLAAGSHTMRAPADALPNGVYFARARIVRQGATVVRTAKAVRVR
jgi:hypothetical protein